MYEYFPGRITIGGKLTLKAPEGKLQEQWDSYIDCFFAKINETSPEFGGNDYYIINTSRTADGILKHLDEKGHLVCCDDSASYGEFDELEGLCQELGLSYDRWSQASCEYEACYSKWRPGYHKAFECQADNSEHEVCDRLPVVEVYEAAYKGVNPMTIATMLKSVLYTIPGFDTEPTEVPKFEIE